MAYATTAQLESRLGSGQYARLTDRVNGATPNAAVAQQILDEAAAIANSYLARRFETPIDVVEHAELADLLETRVLDMAEYLAWRDSPFATDIPERARFIFAEAKAWFEAAAAGRVELPASSPLRPAPTRGAPADCRVTLRTFTHEELDGL